MFSTAQQKFNDLHPLEGNQRPFVQHNISRRAQNSKRKYAEQARLILLLLGGLPVNDV